MSEFSYKPFPKADSLPRDQVDEVSNTINKSWSIFKVKPHHFLSFGNYIVFFNNTRAPAERVSIITKERAEKKRPKDIPEVLLKEIERLKTKHDLTQRQIKQLIKETKKKEIKKLELEKQIEHLTKQAKVLGYERRQKKIKDNFNKYYTKFFDVLNTNLNNLDEPDKNEITYKLRIMAETIEDTIDALSK